MAGLELSDLDVGLAGGLGNAVAGDAGERKFRGRREIDSVTDAQEERPDAVNVNNWHW